MATFLAPTYANQGGCGGEKNNSGSPLRKGKKDNRRDRSTAVRYVQHASTTNLSSRYKRSQYPRRGQR